MAFHKTADPRVNPIQLRINNAELEAINEAWQRLGFESRTSFMIAACMKEARQSMREDENGIIGENSCRAK